MAINSINQNSTEATSFFEDTNVWSPTWKHQGQKFNVKLLSLAQQNQIFHYFAEGARAQEKERQQARRISSHHIYRVSLKSVAEYFGVQPNTLRNNVRASDQYKQFLQDSSQDASDATANVMECIPEIQGAEVAQVQFAQVAAGHRAIGDGEAGDDQPISALGKLPAPQWNEVRDCIILLHRLLSSRRRMFPCLLLPCLSFGTDPSMHLRSRRAWRTNGKWLTLFHPHPFKRLVVGEEPAAHDPIHCKLLYFRRPIVGNAIRSSRILANRRIGI